MCDKLVFDLAQEIEGSPNIFIRKDWLNILDNQNQNYNNNQSVIDTSQLSNSNKWMNYREAYFSIPFLVTLVTDGAPTSQLAAGGDGSAVASVKYWTAATVVDPTATPTAGTAPAYRSTDYSIGLKNWFGQIIHSFTLDYNGTTIIQQTPLVNMWNSFKLMTSLSYGDVITQGSTIGFYPDSSTSWTYTRDDSYSPMGQGVCNNSTATTSSVFPSTYMEASFSQAQANTGLQRRIENINFDLDGIPTPFLYTGTGVKYGALINGVGNTTTNAACVNGSSGQMNNIWKSYISAKQTQTASINGYVQYSIVATVYLKHVHSFFNMVPLLKGVFMKMTMNLNNTTTAFTSQTKAVVSGAGTFTSISPDALFASSVTNPYGGVNPTMISSGALAGGSLPTTFGGSNVGSSGGFGLFPDCNALTAGTAFIRQKYILNLSVGATVLNNSAITAMSAGGGSIGTGQLSKSIYLYVPAYTFNSPFEQAYLSQPVKTIKYTDIYQYQVLNIGTGNQFNNLLTNGIANVKSVLILPFYSSSPTTKTDNAYGVTGSTIAVSSNTGFVQGIPVWQSPFDVAGTGATSPLCFLGNFNVQVSGQNAIYNTQRYAFEQFNNQLYGQNAVNGGLTDGLTSGLVDRIAFDMEYSYYYVNVERMLPVEETVPKSIQILGTNFSARSLDLICFVEYGNEIKIDSLTGARV